MNTLKAEDIHYPTAKFLAMTVPNFRIITLQRQLAIGYNRAETLMSCLIRDGHIGVSQGEGGPIYTPKLAKASTREASVNGTPTPTLYSEDQVRAHADSLLRLRSQLDVALDIGVSPGYFSDYLRSQRQPGAKILKGLGFERVTMFRKIPAAPPC